MALKKQFDFSVHGKGVLVDPTLPLTAANLSFATDVIVINGISYKLADLDSSSKTQVAASVETIVDLLCNLTQTLAMNGASVGAGETLTVTADGITVTYTNGTASAVLGTGGGLATAVKAVCDADAKFAARFDTAVSGDDLLITQKAPQSKIALAVVGGTGFTAGEITVS